MTVSPGDSPAATPRDVTPAPLPGSSTPRGETAGESLAAVIERKRIELAGLLVVPTDPLVSIRATYNRARYVDRARVLWLLDEVVRLRAEVAKLRRPPAHGERCPLCAATETTYVVAGDDTGELLGCPICGQLWRIEYQPQRTE